MEIAARIALVPFLAFVMFLMYRFLSGRSLVTGRKVDPYHLPWTLARVFGIVGLGMFGGSFLVFLATGAGA